MSDRAAYYARWYQENKERLRPMRRAHWRTYRRSDKCRSWRESNREAINLGRKLGVPLPTARLLLAEPHRLRTFKIEQPTEKRT